MNRMLSLLVEHPLLLALVPLTLLGLAGAALLALLLAPERHRRAVDRLAEGAIANLSLGILVIGVPCVALTGLFASGVRVGRGFLALLVVALVAVGVGVCARRLGERVLPEAGPLAQFAVGITGLLLPLLLPVCWPLLPLAAALGAGAWLRARRPVVGG